MISRRNDHVYGITYAHDVIICRGGDETDQRWSAYRDELDAWESVVSRMRE